MALLRNRFLWFFTLGILIITGCNLLSDAGKFSNSDAFPSTHELILSRDITAEQALNFDTPEFKLKIATNALNRNAHLNIFKIPPYLETFPWNGQFTQISSMYRVEITPEYGILRYPASMTFVLPGQTSPSKKYYIAERANNGIWQFRASNFTGQNYVSFAINTFSDCLLVEPTSLFSSSLTESPIITASPAQMLAASTGNFEADLDISVAFAENNGFNKTTPATREVKITAIKPFKLTLAQLEGAAEQELASDINNTITVNLLDTRLAQVVSTGNIATHTFRIKLANKPFSDMPDFLAFTAHYSIPEGLGFSACQTVIFSKKASPPDPENNYVHITDLNPASGSNLISVKSAFIIKFDQAMNTTLTAAAVTIEPALPDGANYIWSDGNTILNIVPRQNLQFASNYRLKVSNAVRSLTGKALQSDLTFSYSSANQTKVLNSWPVDAQTGVTTNTAIEIIFSRSISLATLNSRFMVSSGTVPITGTVTVIDNRAIFVPASALPYSSRINVEILSGVLDDERILVQLPFSSAFTTTAAATPEFKITSSSPADDSVNSPVNQVVEFRFSNSVEKKSLSITYSPLPPDGYIISWSNNDTLLRLTPAGRLMFGHNYQVTIDATTRDVFSSSLTQNSTISFTTIAAVKPVVVSANPPSGSTNVALDQQFKIFFSKEMKQSSVLRAFSISPAASGSALLTWENNNQTLSIGFSQPLNHATFYQIKIGATSADTEDIQLENAYLLSFTTLAKPQVLISNSYPASGSSDLPINTAIKVEFSKAMDHTSAQAAFALTTNDQATPLSGAFSWNGNIMTFTPASILQHNNFYRITIATTATDLAGNSINNQASWQFRTRGTTVNYAYVTGLIPASGSNSISVKSTFVLNFDHAMDTALTAAAISFEPELNGGINFIWSEGNSILNIVPQQNLQFAADYRLKVSNGARSSSGEYLQSDYLIAYSTATPTKVVNSLPEDAQTGVNTNAAIEIVFSRSIIAATLVNRIKVSSGTVNIAGNLTVTDNRAVFIPTTTLPYASNIKIEVLGGVLDSDGLAIQLPFSSTFVTAADANPEFVVISSSPSDGTNNAPISQVVEFKFSNSVDKNTLSVTYSPAPIGGYTTNWSDNDTVLRISPVDKIAYSQNFQVTVNAATRDVHGSSLTQSSAITFTTIAEIKPVVETSSPTTGSANLALDQQFKIYFSKPMNRNSVANAFSISPSTSGTASMTWEDADKTLNISFSEPLNHATSYQIQIASAAADIEGLNLASTFLLDFTTLTKPQVLFTNSFPAVDSTGIPINTAIRVEFSKSMNRASAQAAFALTPDAQPTPLSGAFSWSGNIMTFIPASSLPHNATYRITVATTATDLSGSSLYAQASWKFKTVALTGHLTELLPASGSTSISIKSQFVMKFDLAMNTALTAAAISFEPPLTSGANFIWSSGNSILTMVPLQNLQFGTDYRMKIASSARSINGEALHTDYVIGYSTATPTVVLNSLPVNNQTGVTTNAVIEVVFSHNVDSASLVSRFIVSSGTTNISGNLTVTDNRAVFVPAAPLPFSSIIKIEVLSGVLDSEGLLITLPFSSTFTTTGVSTPEFKITSFSPADGTTNSPVSQAIEFAFSNPVDKNNLSVTYSPLPTGGYTTSWSDNDKLLRLSPIDKLLYSHNYLVTVNAATRDVYGSSLAQSSTISFTTITAVKPEVISTTPSAGSINIPLDQQFRVYFSKQMKQSSVANAFSISPAASGTAALSWEDADHTLVINFSQPLNHATSYLIKIGATSADIEGLQLANAYLLSFTTVAKPQVLFNSSYPTVDSTGLPINTAIIAAFSKTMNQASTQAAFTLKPDGQTTPVNGNFSWSGNNMTFTPAANLLYNTAYHINIATTATDISGNSLSAQASWQFKTAANEGQVWRIEQAQTDVATTFSPRQGHVMITFNNKLWVIGGQGTTYMNDVWSSTDGISWTNQVADGNAGVFKGRTGHACAVFNGRLWLTGGYGEPGDVPTWFDDVWSTADGKVWVQERSSAEYYSRVWHSMAVFNNKLWIIAGETVDGNGDPVLLDDCWSSADGKIWQLRSNIVSFFPRKQTISGVINGKLFVWGGYGQNAEGLTGPLNDVWSTTNGDTWVYEKVHANFSSRCGAGQTIFNSRVWISGGSNRPDQIGAICYNDVWASNDGLNWIEILSNSSGTAEQFSPRARHQLAPLGERLFLSGGENVSESLNEVWSTK